MIFYVLFFKLNDQTFVKYAPNNEKKKNFNYFLFENHHDIKKIL